MKFPLFRRPSATPVSPVTCDIPIPPPEMRALVGPTEESAFDNPEGVERYPGATRFFDFGCGCGRVARQLIQQKKPLERYMGIDLHAGMVRWCNQNLAPVAPQFEFRHHNVWNLVFNPTGKGKFQPLPVEDRAFDYILAHSVFTHILQDEVVPYLREISRILMKGGTFRSTWFTFEKKDFPMLHDFQNALYVNLQDPTNATIYDRDWIRQVTKEAGLTIVEIVRPEVRGHQWTVDLKHTDAVDHTEVDWPQDSDVLGRKAPPTGIANPHLIGLG